MQVFDGRQVRRPPVRAIGRRRGVRGRCL